MRRRDVLKTVGLAAGSAVLPFARTTSAHPGPYRPYGRVEIKGAKEAVVGADGTTVYLAVSDGFAIVDVSDPANPDLLAERRGILEEHEDGPLNEIYDVKIDNGTLLVVGPAHGGASTALRGAAIYDVSDPADPQRTGFYETDYPIHNSFLADGIAYLTRNTSDATSLVLVDITGETLREVGRWALADYNSAWEQVSVFVRTMHDVYVHGDIAYLAHWDAGTWLLDVSDPSAPTVISQVGGLKPEELQQSDVQEAGYQLPGNSHSAAVNDDASVLAVGMEAWDVEADDRAGGPGGIDLYDIADPTNPTKLAHIAPPPTPDPTRDGVWTTSHNFDFHGDRLYTSWYQGGVKLFDVSDPAAPEELAWWRKPAETSFWTAQHAAGCFVGASRHNPAEDTANGSGAALYTFPDHPGVQENPPSLTPTNSTTTQTDTPTTTAATTTTTTDTSSPGFGALAALGALGAAAWQRWSEG